MDTFYGIGYTLGPVLGSWLFPQAGFPAPFLVCGVGLLLTGLASITLVHIPDLQAGQAATPPPDHGPLLSSLLRQPQLLLALLSATATTIAIGYIGK